ncbi:MAG: hypothetical protein ABL899_00725 [Nitrospira sp.]
MKNIKTYILLASFILIPFVTTAQNGINPGEIKPIPSHTSTPAPTQNDIDIYIPNPTNAGDNLISVLKTLLEKVVMPVAAVAIVCWIIWAGFQFVMAQGNPNAIKDAKNNLLWALIGAGILLGAVGISTVVQNTVSSLLVP